MGILPSITHRPPTTKQKFLNKFSLNYHLTCFKLYSNEKNIPCIVISNTCICREEAQNSYSDTEAVTMLKAFYIVYNTAWSTSNLKTEQGAHAFIKKLDSLQTEYCTIKLRKGLNKLFKKEGLDHDLLTNDEFTDIAHLKTLKIVKDESKTNAYTVSYVDHATLSPAYKPIDNTVIIHVTVAKENGRYKIADAYGDAISLR